MNLKTFGVVFFIFIVLWIYAASNALAKLEKDNTILEERIRTIEAKLK